ncbi:Amuc_1098 family type IV pilus outer membrane protein [Haloferula sargassicola]|uniref:Amuc_1098 family type IV pilus outer membrane protein n=1 Tax=Haloferula sargassicola TaxID=490096 RepID=UPI0033658835
MILLTAFMCGSVPLVCPAQSPLVEAELQRRSNAAAEAHELMVTGDKSYEEGNYEEAAKSYRRAVELLPAGAPALAEQRAHATERFAQASVEVARQARRFGDLDKAESVLDEVLKPEMAPDDVAAITEKEQLLDPIRTNPASSKEHTSDIEEVRFLLYRAQGAYDLGKYDEAALVYEDVLRVDPTNTAARRGMEKVAAAKSSYYDAARDHTRAEMMAMVDGAWELQPPALDEFGFEDVMVTNQQATIDYSSKLRSIEIPVVMLEDVSIREAIDFIRAQAADLDTQEIDPARRGVNIVLDLGSDDQAILDKRFTINLRSVPIRKVIDYICQETGTVAVEQPVALVIRPAGSDSTDMMARTFRVPPDFLSSGAAGTQEDSPAEADPFGDNEDSGGGVTARRLTAQQVLESRGVSFPEGASANFNSANSELRVMNTSENLSMVQQVVDAMASNEPTSVIVEVKVLRTTQRNLEELGFDWLLGNFGFAGMSDIPGASKFYIGGGTQGNGGSLAGMPAGGKYPNPVTAGNRSGQEAIPLDSIDDLIANRDRITQSVVPRAPGALWVNGYLNDTFATMMMRGLSQKKGIDLMVQPSVVTRSGQAASVRVTEEFIYPTEYEPPELPNSVGSDSSAFIDLTTGTVLTGQSTGSIPVTPSTPTSFEMRETGVVLEVLPTVSSDKHYVNISLKPDLTEFDGFVNYGSPITAGASGSASLVGGVVGISSDPIVITPNEILMPVFSKMGTETALTVADDSTVVIGGMLRESRQKVEDRTPILGDLPLVGRLFQSNVEAPTKTSILFLVHVRVVDAAGRPFNQR